MSLVREVADEIKQIRPELADDAFVISRAYLVSELARLILLRHQEEIDKAKNLFLRPSQCDPQDQRNDLQPNISSLVLWRNHLPTCSGLHTEQKICDCGAFRKIDND